MYVASVALDSWLFQNVSQLFGPSLFLLSARRGFRSGMESGGQGLPRGDRAASRSRSPARAASAGNLPAGHWSASLAAWDGHFDGRVRPFRHGFVLGVADARVDGLDRRRTLFCDAFAGNQGFCGDRILIHCLQRHAFGRRWEDVLQLWDALREVALAEFRERSGE